MERERVRIRKRNQVTLPKRFIEALGLGEDSDIEIRLLDDRIEIIPMVSIPKDQAWFWSDEWQGAERIADEQIASGEVIVCETDEEVDDLFDRILSDKQG